MHAELAPADILLVTWFLPLFLALDPPPQAERVRAAMNASLEAQRASVVRQVQSARPGAAVPAPETTAGPTARATACDPIPQPQLAQMIDQAARNNQVEPSLVREVARQESAFRPCAVSPKGAEGLMQLMPATQATLHVTDPFDPHQNLEAGSRLLKELLERYHGDIALALSAYNAGPRRVEEAGGIPKILETTTYVQDILTRLAPVD